MAIGGLGAAIALGGSLITHPTAAVPGDPDRFDPIAAYPKVRDYAGDGAMLTSMSALLVRSDGTLDLAAGTAPSPTAVYSFVRPIKRRNGDLEAVTVMVAEPWRNVTIGQGDNEVSYLCRGMDRTLSAAIGAPAVEVTPPRCPLADLWKTAIERGANKASLANVLYGPAGYAFMIPSGRLAIQFGTDCAVKVPPTPSPPQPEPPASP
jgi:hypothetical protein